MQYRVRFTASAETQLEALYLWIVARAPTQGAAWFNRLEEAILSLGRYPKRCPMAVESFDPQRPVRVLHHGRAPHVYRVLFWIDEQHRVVHVLHVRHGARRSLNLGRADTEA